jgi:RimJ/RimL family protein N-acetyltransferase
MSFDHLFSSDRLIYRALEDTTENKEHFRNVMLNDPNTVGQSVNRLLKPLTSADVDRSFSGASESFLSVIMYLKPEGAHPSSPTTPPVGWLSLDSHPTSRHHRSCTMGITISTDYQGQGYGTEAIIWALDWAFRIAGMHAV